MKYFLVNPRMPREPLEDRFGDAVIIPSDICASISTPVSAHPDMTAVKVGDVYVCHTSNKAAAGLFSSADVNYTVSETPLSEKYPGDIAFNCFAVKNTLFGRLPYLAPEIISAARDQGMGLCDVRQGYAKCSSLVIGDAVITADKGIYDAVCSSGADALLISGEGIVLDGYERGFIGGASGSIDGSTAVLFGSLSAIPDGKKIEAFCARLGKTIVSLSEEPPCDLGGLICIEK